MDNSISSNDYQSSGCLEDGSMTDMTLDDLNDQRIAFGKDSISTKLQNSYYEPADDEDFPAIDSLTPQGMFDIFRVADKYPIRGVDSLRKLCTLYGNEPKRYFVVPSHQFDKSTKQSFKSNHGEMEVESIAGLQQYVIKLLIQSSWEMDDI